ncbi:hypothetical protein ADN00_15665 [Ornatilinea apprima]|uniref:Uncharacterized protein n=1 Tax=Ornatilinea apprima TaxID=1134406 RepID=A0A0P6XAQ8_9CHLR|nr:hypothetical protein [Ornatilinea apprima]KPL72253.1 hypothetical protein ADN00_15665 [Ornatilinea apprima]
MAIDVALLDTRSSGTTGTWSSTVNIPADKSPACLILFLFNKGGLGGVNYVRIGGVTPDTIKSYSGSNVGFGVFARKDLAPGDYLVEVNASGENRGIILGVWETIGWNTNPSSQYTSVLPSPGNLSFNPTLASGQLFLEFYKQNSGTDNARTAGQTLLSHLTGTGYEGGAAYKKSGGPYTWTTYVYDQYLFGLEFMPLGRLFFIPPAPIGL